MDSSPLRRWLREPLLHFVLLGGALFLGYRQLHHVRTGPVVITAEQRARLRADFARRTGAPPSTDEERQLLERHIEDELLLREAERLHLADGDVIVRRRLLQKMQLLVEARHAPPSDAEIAAYFAAHRDRFAGEERRSFTLRAVDAQGRMIATPLSTTQLGQSKSDLQRRFGAEFAARVFELPIGAAPAVLSSPIGAFEIGVTERIEAPADLAARRSEVAAELERERGRALLGAELAALRRRYSVELR